MRSNCCCCPYLQLIGAALLVWIGIKLIAEDEGEDHEIAASDRLISAVKTVIVADLVMSLDNVIGVAGAAKGSLVLLIFGLVVSIPLVVVGSQLIMKLIERFPWLVVAGGGLLGYIAGEIATQDAAVKAWVDAQMPALHWVGARRRCRARRRRRHVARAALAQGGGPLSAERMHGGALSQPSRRAVTLAGWIGPHGGRPPVSNPLR